MFPLDNSPPPQGGSCYPRLSEAAAFWRGGGKQADDRAVHFSIFKRGVHTFFTFNSRLYHTKTKILKI